VRGALAKELDVCKVDVEVRVFVVIVLGRNAKGKGGLGERRSREVVVHSIVERGLHAAVCPRNGLVEVKHKVVSTVGVRHEVASKVARKTRSALARCGPRVQRILDDDGILV